MAGAGAGRGGAGAAGARLAREAVARLRAETPGVPAAGSAAGGLAHLNNAGAALVPEPVLAAQVDFLREEATRGGYEAAERAEATGALRRPYVALARLLGCAPEEVAVVQSATAAWQQVFYGLDLGPNDDVLFSEAEYGSNFIAALQCRKRRGCRVRVVPNDSRGQLDVSALDEMLREPRGGGRRVVAVTHIPTSSGTVNPAAEIGKVCARHGAPFLLDACQTVGQLAMDVRAWNCTWATGTGRKYLRAPRGSGFLYASPEGMELAEPGFLDNWGAEWTAMGEYTLHPTARRYESYEMSVAAKVGLGVAAEYALAVGPEAAEERIVGLAESLRAQLQKLEGVQVHDRGPQLCGIVSFTKEGCGAQGLKESLALAGVNVTVSRRPSTRADFERRGLEDVVRASVHYFNTEDELQRLVDAVAEAPPAT